jgi:hypothetical protein
MFTWLTTFSLAHPWLFALLVLPVVAWTVVQPIRLGFRAWNRLLRSQNIAARGWPPSHLDADGDPIRPEVD